MSAALVDLAQHRKGEQRTAVDVIREVLAEIEAGTLAPTALYMMVECPHPTEPTMGQSVSYHTSNMTLAGTLWMLETERHRLLTRATGNG